MIKKNKKGIQLNEAFVSVLTIVLVAVLVIVAIFLFNALGTSMQIHNTLATVTNETGSANTTGYNLSTKGALDFANPTVTALWNRTSNVKIGNGNATISAAGLVTNGTTTNWNNVSISYTYTYTADSDSTTAANETVSNFSGYPALIGLLGTIIFLGIVIGVLVSSFMPGNKP